MSEPLWASYDELDASPVAVEPPWLLHDEDPPQAEPVAPAHTWAPLDLLVLGAKPPEPPEVGGLLYRGRRHVVSGEDDAGKTMLHTGLASDELKIGHGVVWIDTDDMGPSIMLERLRAFGADDEAIRRLFAYVRPEEALSESSSADVVALIRELDARLLVIDSFNAALALHGYNPKASEEVEAFWQRVVSPFCRSGAAVSLLDHVVKAKEERGRYAYGSERKATGTDLHLGLRVIEPFGRGRRGKAKLTVHRDRVGFLAKPSPGLFVLDSDPESGRLAWELQPDQGGDDEGLFRPTRLMEKVSRYLEVAGEPRSRSQIEADVRGKRDYLRHAIDALVHEGYVEEIEGPRGARLARLERVFREDEDEAE